MVIDSTVKVGVDMVSTDESEYNSLFLQIWIKLQKTSKKEEKCR